ncbi:MAG: cytochrome c biogenesis protein CcsA, partial [Pyrodictiaceae archaeon]
MALHPIGYFFIAVILSYLATILLLPGNIRRGLKLFKASSILLVVAWLLYVSLFVRLDYSLAEVYWNTSPSLPLWMRIGSSWASSGGSLLLFASITALSSIYLLWRANERYKRVTLALSSVIIATLIVSFTSRAFDYLVNPPPAGAGLNPLLKSPWLYPHPLATFGGYSLLLVGSLAIGMAGDRNKGSILLRLGWSMLTIGIMLGAYWSYETFGWGGYWAWDPVETSELMVWLVASSLLHLAPLSRSLERSLLPLLSSSIFLAMFVTRTGLSPLHSFAAPSLGSVLLLAGALTGLAAFMVLVSSRWASIYTELRDTLKQRGTYHVGLFIAGLSLALSAFFVYASLLVPAVLTALGLEVSVPQMASGAAYYNPPLFILMLVFLVAVPLVFLGERIGWRGYLSLLFSETALSILLVMGVLTGKLFVAPLSPLQTNVMIVVGLVSSLTALAAIIVSLAFKKDLRVPRLLILKILHIGMTITIIGILLSATFSFSQTYAVSLVLKPGEEVKLPGGVRILLEDYNFSISNSLVDIYTGYAGKSPIYFMAWSAISALENDLGMLLQSIKQGQELVNSNTTLRTLLELAEKPVNLGSLALELPRVELIQENIVTNKTLVYKNIALRLVLENASFYTIVRPLETNQGLSGTIEAYLHTARLQLQANGTSLEGIDMRHSYCELRLLEPNIVGLPKTSIKKIVIDKLVMLPAMNVKILNNSLILANSTIYVEGRFFIEGGGSIRTPLRVGPEIALYYMHRRMHNSIIDEIMHSSLGSLLLDENAIKSILEPSDCKGLS